MSNNMWTTDLLTISLMCRMLAELLLVKTAVGSGIEWRFKMHSLELGILHKPNLPKASKNKKVSIWLIKSSKKLAFCLCFSSKDDCKSNGNN